MPPQFSRRDWLAVSAAACTIAATSASAGEDEPLTDQSFGICLNTSTLRGHKLTIVEEVNLAAEAGYQGIEPWIRELDQYVESGGSLADLAKRIQDKGLTVASGIGFARWVVDDPTERAAGLEQAKRDMDRLKQIGGTHIAAPPAGATDKPGLNLIAAAERYRALLEVGDEIGVIPQVEVWGFSQSMSRLGEAILVAVESGHPNACVLADVYHMYKGGSDPSGLRLLNASALGVFHINDYPDIPRETINDADRVYPGDGVAPLAQILETLRAIGYRGMLSLELFNKQYWEQPAAEVARTGAERIRAAIQQPIQ